MIHPFLRLFFAGRANRFAFAFALLLPLAALLSGCVEDDVSSLGAQGDDVAEDDTTAAEAEIPVADTLSMTAAEAVANSLAANVGTSTDSAATDTAVALSEPVSAPAPAATSRHRAEDPAFAEQYGWPVEGPATLPGAILPANRIVCYYGNPNSTRMGALGQYPKDEMLSRLRDQIAKWERADPDTPVKPCLHMVSAVAQAEPGTAGHYRSIMLDEHVQKVYDWAKEMGGIFIVDLQVGTDDVRNILPRFEWILKNPDVHVAVDPEFYMKDGTPPGQRIGRMDAADINYVSGYLANLVREYDLPPKVFIVHRFTKGMVTNSTDIRLRPEVQIVMHMDGWGAPWLKRDSYRDYIIREPVQYTGFKIFYGNDTKTGLPIMAPEDLLRLRPTPLYVQYQ